MKKCISFTLALLLSALASCGTETQVEENSTELVNETAATETETERVYPDVTGIDYAGEAFNVMYFGPGPNNGYSDGFYFDLEAESETGDILLDSLYHRNRKVEDALNVNLQFTEYISDGDMLSAMRMDVMSGAGDFDLYVPYLRYYPNLINEKLAIDLTTVDTLDLTMPWWDTQSASELSIMGGLWAIISDWTIADKMSSFCIMFSKQLVADFDLEDPYQLVLDGKWTFDYMTEKARLVENDLNGNSKRDLEDRYGIMCDVDFSYANLHAGGYKIAEKDADDIPQLSIYGEQEISALQKIYGVMRDTYFLNRKNAPETSGQMTMQKMAQMFANNQVLYFTHIPEALLELRQSTNDFGIIPLPKLDENQERYYTPVTHWAATISAIPVSVKDVDRSATVLNLLAAESSYEVMPNLYEVILDVKYTRDDESAQMLDIIFENRTYDTGLIMDFDGIGYDVHANYYSNENFVSKMESSRKSVENAYNKTIDEIRARVESDV